MTSSRRKIIEELFQSDLITDYSDLSTIATALDQGLAADDILYSSTVENWPGLFTWLQKRMEYPDSKKKKEFPCCF